MATSNPFANDKELLAYSDEHLLYEIEMFRWLVSVLPGKEPSSECSAFVESFALHLRNLIDFFYIEPVEDDVVAEYFYDDPSKWNTKWNAGTMPPALAAAKKRVNKESNHLTKARVNVTPTDKIWRTGGLYSEIQKVAQEFIAGASRMKLSPKFIAFITSHYNAPTATILRGSDYGARTNVAIREGSFVLPVFGPILKPRT